ncbi:MAG: hypothetical protein HQ472_02035 [Ignavibacteria bacterium]|nr:hypothetical protein [Ignavibacteria bacterium]
MSHLNSDEALHAFMDGELRASDEQLLFNELASNGELRTEMKDLIAIRNAVQRDSIFPYAANEASILAAAGFAPSAGAIVAAGANTAAIVAAHSAWVKGVLLSIGSVAGGVLLALLAIGQAPFNPSANQPVAGLPTPPAQMDAAFAGAPKVDTVFSIRIVRVPMPAEQPVLQASATEIVSTPNSNTESESVVPDVRIASVSFQKTSMQMDGASGQDKIPNKNLASYISEDAQRKPVIVRFRTLANGISNSEMTPVSVQNALLPNTAYGLFIPIAENHKVGIEMGTESFKQVFNGIVDGRQGQYTQTPVLFWMGGTYNYTANSFSFLPGVSPFAEATVGAAFAQGPLGRATIGLAYQPFGPLRITAGLDGSTLMYRYQGQWFSTSKFGMSYGISFDLGALK